MCPVLAALVSFNLKMSQITALLTIRHRASCRTGVSLLSRERLFIQDVTGGTEQTSGGCSLC